METLFKGLVMGFCIAAPVGPVGLLCIRRSMTHGRLVGFVSGLGAATADAVYGLIAALGLTAITTLLVAHRTPIQLVGGLFLLFIGARILRQPPARAADPADAAGLGAAYLSTLALTLTNPATILAFVGIFAGLGIGLETHGAWAAGLLVAGVFLGSVVWWLILSSAANWLGGKALSGHLRFVNLLSGGLIIVFGLWEIGTLLLRR